MNTLHARDQAGFTLVEMIVTAALLGGLVYAVSTLSASGIEAQDYARRLNRTTEIAHDLIDQFRTDAMSCARVFGNDTEGTENLDVFELTGAPTPIAGSRLPVISPDAVIQPDTVANQISGNSLFLTKLAWTDRFATGGTEYMVDVYRWVYVYLTPEDGGPVVGSPFGLNLVRIESEPLVDGAGIDRITVPAHRAAVLEHLRVGSPDATGASRTPCSVVWRRGALPSVAGTLRFIESGGVLDNDPGAGRPSPWSVLRAQADVRGLLSYRHHSIATNFARANLGVSRYSVQDLPLGFPHGFEVQVVGPATARQILTHIVLVSTRRRGQLAFSDVQVIMDTKDL